MNRRFIWQPCEVKLVFSGGSDNLRETRLFVLWALVAGDEYAWRGAVITLFVGSKPLVVARTQPIDFYRAVFSFKTAR